MSLEPAAGQTSSGEWLKFDTDACGQLGRVEGPGSALVERAAGDDEDESDDEDDDYSWTQVWGIPDEDSSQAEQWHLDHPRVAIVTDAIARSCETDPSDVDAPDAEELA